MVLLVGEADASEEGDEVTLSGDGVSLFVTVDKPYDRVGDE